MKKTNQILESKVNFLSRGFSILCFALLVLFTVSNAQAQEAQTNKEYIVQGTVLDEDNMPLPGVNVIIKGTKTGVVTDIDGKFKFSALKANTKLVFSYIGYDSKLYTIPKSNSDTVKVDISFDAADIELMGAVAVNGVYKTKRNIFQKFVGLFK